MKRYLSLFLVFLMAISAVSAITASAEDAEYNEQFGLPEIEEGYNRYFFLMPENWLWDESVTAGIYWDEGSEHPESWPGYKATKADFDSIYYYDVPSDVEKIIWNNFYESGDISSSISRYNKRTDYLPTKDAEHHVSHNRMIAVVNQSMFDDTQLSDEYPTCNWYGYYGNGEYGTKTTPEDSDTYRYYFYLPEEWENEYSSTAGIYWWEGKNAQSAYPGVETKKTNIKGLYYYDVPKDVTEITWNNFFGTRVDEPEKLSFSLSTNILSCFNNDNKVFVIDTDKTIQPDGSVSKKYFGQWYYYYGHGEYGLTQNKTNGYYTCRSFGGSNPAPKLETNRYYFYMPNDWENELSKDAGIYWWEGTSACRDNWPGYKAKKTDFDGLYYYDVPKDVTSIIWNNYIDGGVDPEAEIYKLAQQTRNIGSEYYEKGESELYPEGVASFDEMVYVIDYDKYDEFSWDVEPIVGEWYYYYGNGEYGTTPEKGDIYYTNRYFGTAPGDKVYPTNPPEPDVKDIKIYFIDTVGWEEVYIQHHTNYGLGQSNQEPGDLMNFEGLNIKGNKVYSYNIPLETSWVVFSNGTEKSHDVSVNITDNVTYELTHKLDGKYLYTASLFKDKSPLLGDVNLDGKVNIRDATAIQKHLANIETIEGLGKPAADFNQDGRITIQDATAIQKKIANTE